MAQGTLVIEGLLARLNGKDYERHDMEKIFEVRYFRALDDGSAKVVLKLVDNPDYDPGHWGKVKAAIEQRAQNESNE